MTVKTDFNDLAAVSGLQAVRTQVMAAIQTPALDSPPAPDAPTTQFQVNWPEPSLPGADGVPEIPTELLPQWMGDFAKAVSHSTQTPPALSVLAGVATLD